MVFQVPPLHMTLVEVHQELANKVRVAKDMTNVTKRTTKAADPMQEWLEATQAKEELEERLQRAKSKLKEVEDRLQIPSTRAKPLTL